MRMSGESDRQRGRQGRQGTVVMIVVPCVAALLMLLFGWQPTESRGGWPAVKGMLLAQAIVAGAIYATMLPVLPRIAKAAPNQRLALFFKASGRRLAITLIATVAVVLEGWASPRPFLIWIGVAYVVMTMAETIALARLLSGDQNQDGKQD